MVDIIQRIIPSTNRNRPGTRMVPLYITVHNTDNPDPGADALSHARYLENGAGGLAVSWHFTVDDTNIVQHLPENETGWHAGDGNGPGNIASIGIEICENADGDYSKAEANAIQLIQYVMQKHQIPISNVVPHQRWSGKYCPHLILPRWDEFMSAVERKDDFTGHWAEKAIREVISKGLMTGYPDGTFKPDQPITRAELAAVLSRLINSK